MYPETIMKIAHEIKNPKDKPSDDCKKMNRRRIGIQMLVKDNISGIIKTFGEGRSSFIVNIMQSDNCRTEFAIAIVSIFHLCFFELTIILHRIGVIVRNRLMGHPC